MYNAIERKFSIKHPLWMVNNFGYTMYDNELAIIIMTIQPKVYLH